MHGPFPGNLGILLFWAFVVLMRVWRIAMGSFGSMLSGSWIWITFLILLNYVVWGVSVVKAWSAVFTGNSGVSSISVTFFILVCDVAYFGHIHNLTFATLVLFLVVSNTVDVILLLDFWVLFLYLPGLLFCHCFRYFFQLHRSYELWLVITWKELSKELENQQNSQNIVLKCHWNYSHLSQIINKFIISQIFNVYV